MNAKKLTVAFYVYPTAFQSPGGGEIMLLKTKEYLEKQGVAVKLLDPWRDKLRDFDILHTFGSVKDALRMMETANQCGVKNVLSTVCWYGWKSAWGASVSPAGRLGSLARQAVKSLVPGFPSPRRAMMQCADLCLPNSHAEAGQLRRYFGVPENKIHVVPNGVDERFLHADPAEFKSRFKVENFILCVGRIEPRKNTLNVIRALKGCGRPLVIVGDTVPHYQDYARQCRQEAGPEVLFTGPIDHESSLLSSAMAACNTFLLATWLETPGLAALEAALAGAKVVITCEGATQEYFGDFVDYVNPSDTGDIRRKVKASYMKSVAAGLREHVLKHYTWKQTAQATLEAYQTLMARV